jgi:hypothetical protein
MRRFVVSYDLQDFVQQICEQQICEGGDSNTPIELLNLLAAHVLDTHGRQHKDKKKRFVIFADRADDELSDDAVLMLRVLMAARDEKKGGKK